MLAVVLAPLLLAAALCLLPDALNLQYHLATTFEPGSQNISYTQVESVDAPAKTAPLQEPQPFSPWVTKALHVIFGLVTLLVTLVTLSSLKRIQAGIREPSIIGEAIEVYRRSIPLAPGFIWVTILQLLAPAAGLFLFQETSNFMPGSVGVWAYIALVLMIMLGALIYAWLYFAQFALIFDGKHSWHALLFSRDLMRKRFFKVATRIVVFLAVWSGYNTWAAGAFVVVSLLFGPVGVVTGFLGTIDLSGRPGRDRRQLCDHRLPGRGGLAALPGLERAAGSRARRFRAAIRDAGDGAIAEGRALTRISGRQTT